MYLNLKTKKFLLLPLAFFTMFFRADYFPQSDNWEISSPEVEGISSLKVDKLMEMSFLDKATQAVVVIKNGKIISEKYADGYDMNSHGTSWSMAKSFYAALVGISLEKGEIGSLDDPVSKYLPQFGDDRRSITLRNILNMDGIDK